MVHFNSQKNLIFNMDYGGGIVAFVVSNRGINKLSMLYTQVNLTPKCRNNYLSDFKAFKSWIKIVLDFGMSYLEIL